MDLNVRRTQPSRQLPGLQGLAVHLIGPDPMNNSHALKKNLSFFVVVGNIIVGLLSIDRIDVASQLASCFFVCVCVCVWWESADKNNVSSHN
jgi:hypothetical protein